MAAVDDDVRFAQLLQSDWLPRGGYCTAHLHVLQLFDQRPAAYEALVEQGEDGRTFQDGLPESSPRTCKDMSKNTQKCTIEKCFVLSTGWFCF